MFIKTCTRNHKGKEYKSNYLVESYRDTDGKIKHKHIMNLSNLGSNQILALKSSFNKNSLVDKIKLENLEVYKLLYTL